MRKSKIFSQEFCVFRRASDSGIGPNGPTTQNIPWRIRKGIAFLAKKFFHENSQMWRNGLGIRRAGEVAL